MIIKPKDNCLYVNEIFYKKMHFEFKALFEFFKKTQKSRFTVSHIPQFHHLSRIQISISKVSKIRSRIDENEKEIHNLYWKLKI